MSGGPDSTAKNRLILAWILLTATITACWLAPKPVPRVITMTLTAVTVAIPIVAWTSGVQENVSVMPFFPLALGFLAVAVSSGKRSRPEPAESSGSPLHHG